ncbi:DedA family protein [Piscinibacter sakaiensis]|uniref:DedA family protein n=1 Tax=Piscinibacter sakaiensis TaxID=1547922 RepID=UPI003AAB5A0C
MTDWLLALVPQYGIWLLGACTFLSCLALPVPASILMLAAGGFVASDDLSLTGSVAAALTGAIAGDQVGYFGGRWGGTRLIERLGSRVALLGKAMALLAARGGLAVYLSRWLVSALGPYVNLAAGAARQRWASFTLWAIAGEATWVGIYIGLGYVFTGNIAAASSMALEVLGFFAAGAVALGLAVWLTLTVKEERARARQAD